MTYVQKELITFDGEKITVNAETKAKFRRHGDNYYFDCTVCKNDCFDGIDCCNKFLVEGALTKKGNLRIYCRRYEKL